jgi:hypothetical protein
MLQIVKRDIAERENLINFVFKERLDSIGLGSTILRGSMRDSLGGGSIMNVSGGKRRPFTQHGLGGGDDEKIINIHDVENGDFDE